MANKPSKPKLIQIKWPTPTVFCKNLLHVWGNHRGIPPEVRLSYEGFHVPCAWRCGLRGSASWQCRTWTTCNCSLDRIVNARTDAAEYCKSSARFVSFHLYASLSPLCDFRWFYWVQNMVMKMMQPLLLKLYKPYPLMPYWFDKRRLHRLHTYFCWTHASRFQWVRPDVIPGPRSQDVSFRMHSHLTRTGDT